MSRKEFIKCPICKGAGIVPPPQSSRIGMHELKRGAAVVLRQKGYGVRQIQRLLGYKSPHSAQVLLQGVI
jgi:hypothetical protein